ncbi:MAG: hypothetical protein N2C14_19295, partial [Planctomycetales bacterium]
GLGAYLLAVSLKGDKARVNQASVVDVDVASGALRGTTWLNVFSPVTATYQVGLDVEPPEDSAEAETLLSWLPAPESNALRATYQQSSGVLSARPYVMDLDKPELTETPNQVWSAKGFSANWRRTGSRLLELENMEVDDEDVERLTVVSRLPFALSECILVSHGWAYSLGELPADARTAFTPDSGRRQRFSDLLSGLAQHYDKEREDYVLRSPVYKQHGTDVYEILEKIMFHDLAGGREYTKLWNRREGRLDLSFHVGQDQAILIGRADRPPLDASLDGQSIKDSDRIEKRYWTYYRFLLPVLEKANPDDASRDD